MEMWLEVEHLIANDYALVHVDSYRRVSCIFTCPARDALIKELAK